MLLIRNDHIEFRGSDEVKVRQWAVRLGVSPEAIKKALWTLMVMQVTRGVKPNGKRMEAAAVNE